ncbi:MAG: hypothetical protein AAFY85_09010, partial [Pseudomonadota bacterium]
MQTGDQFEDLSNNLAGTQDRVRDAKSPVTSARESAQDVEDILGVFEDIGDRADEAEDALHSLAKLAKLIAKVPALSVVANAFSEILNTFGDTVERFEARAKELAKRVDPLEDKVEEGREKLEEFEEKFDEADENIGEVRSSVDSTASVIDTIADYAPAAAADLDAVAVAPNLAVIEINNLYDTTKEKADALLNAVNDTTGIVDEVKQIQRDLEAITEKLAFLREPLSGLNAIIKPISWALDAADFVFNAVVKPILDPALEALGINKLLDDAEKFIDNLLPDINLLEDATDFIDDVAGALDVNLSTSFIGELTNPLESFTVRIRQDLIDPFDLSLPANAPTALGDVLMGTSIAETISGLAGDDVISGGGGNDVLNGGEGEDLLIGGVGNDMLDGGGPSTAGN